MGRPYIEKKRKDVGKRVVVMEVPRIRRRGRPKRRWLGNISTGNDLNCRRELSGEEEQDRIKWKRMRKRKKKLSVLHQ